jgi:transposase
MNTGKYIFSQVADYIPKYEFDCIVRKYHGDYHVRDLNCYNLFLHMMFGQLTACNSIRDICLCLKAHQKILYHLGFRQTVNVSSLSRANRDRDYRIWEELGYVLIDIVRPLYAKERIPDVYLPGWEIFAVDSTTISCSIKLITWAQGKYERGAVKMHTMLSLRGSIPTFIHITHGKWHDSNFLDVFEIERWAIYVMDKAYVDFAALFNIDRHNAYWITRAKSNMRYEVEETNYNIDEITGVRGDCTIRLTGQKPSKLYPKEMRMVKYYDAENDEELTFITNQMDLGALQIANLYRNRWQIETFFKWVKQNLTIKSFWGHSENAVKTHLWIAICTYLIVARIKASIKDCPYTITEVATLLGISALAKIDLVDLLTNPDNDLLNQNQNVKELTLF